MNTGDRIKQRRIELGLTADALAEKIGKSRATIYRYENGDIENMPTPILEPLAKALNTTPADLMGWDDQEQELPSTPDSLTVTGLEKDIIIEYRRSDDIAQAIVLRALDLDDGSRKEEAPRAAEPETPPAPVRKGFNSLMDEINEPMLNAAHALDGATPEEIQHDEDIMNDDSEWE